MRRFKYLKNSPNLMRSIDDAWFEIGMCMLKKEKFFESIHYFKKAGSCQGKRKLLGRPS